jgi:hypothetical protein
VRARQSPGAPWDAASS